MEPRTDQQTGPRWILVVDGDVPTQRLLDLALRNAGFEVKAVATAREADAWLVGHTPDLIVSETHLSDGPDGFELCRQIKRRPDGADIPFVFLSERTVEAKVKAVEAGSDDFLAKPLYVQEIVAHARALMQRRERDRFDAVARGDESFAGDIDDLPLVDLLRAIEASRKSGVVVMASRVGARGEIYFRDGVVVDAEVGHLSGLEAVCRLFSWSHGRFEIDWKNIRRKDAVAMEPSALLMEALRRVDEWRRLLAEVPPLETVFEVDYHLLAERLAEIPDEVNAILRLFDGQRTFIQVIDDCGLADLDALAVISKLSREMIIRDARTKPPPAPTPGADMEGWLTEAAGPFRAPPSRMRRELFAAAPQASPHVGRITSPLEPLEEAGRDALVEERRERFTDRLIAESAAPPSAPMKPIVPPAPPPPVAPPSTHARAPVPAAETTQQGIGLPAPPLSTRPGFAVVTAPLPPPPRPARFVPAEPPTDVTPAVQDAKPAVDVEGVPEPVAPQSPEPAIVVPVPETPVAAAPIATLAAAPTTPMADLPNVPEQRPVAGEIVARPSAANPAELAGDGPMKRNTDPGLGPKREPAAQAVRPPGKPVGAGARMTPSLPMPAFRRTSATMKAVTGDVFGGGARRDSRPIRKIILDPEVPEDDVEAPTGSRAKRWLAIGVGIALTCVATWVLITKTGRRHEQVAATETTPKKETPVAPQVDENPRVAEADAAAAVDASAVVAREAVATAAAPPEPRAGPHGGGAHHAAAALADSPKVVLDERSADPKVARAATTEFPQLLAGCRQAFTEKRARDAEIACVAAKDANPDSAEACALLGHALFNRKKHHEALQWAERAVALDPKEADAYVIIGGVKQAADDTAGAKAAYKKYLELAPTGQYASDLRAIVDSL
jgi:CheY-like chemotaxis protein